MTSKEDARAVAERLLDESDRRNHPYPLIIVENAIWETVDEWVFPWDGKGYVEDDDFRYAVAGNLPIAVNKRTLEAHFSTLRPPLH